MNLVLLLLSQHGAPWERQGSSKNGIGIYTLLCIKEITNENLATGLEKVSFHSNPKERQCQRMFKLPNNCSHLNTSKVMLKILQARLQQYMNCELLDVQAGLRKGRGTRDQIANIRWIREKAKEFQKNIYFCFIDYAKAFDCVGHNKLWKILKEMGISDHLTCLLRNLYAGQEATVRTGHGTTDWFQIGKGGAWWATVHGGHKRVGHDLANNINKLFPQCLLSHV